MIVGPSGQFRRGQYVQKKKKRKERIETGSVGDCTNPTPEPEALQKLAKDPNLPAEKLKCMEELAKEAAEQIEKESMGTKTIRMLRPEVFIRERGNRALVIVL